MWLQTCSVYALHYFLWGCPPNYDDGSHLSENGTPLMEVEPPRFDILVPVGLCYDLIRSRIDTEPPNKVQIMSPTGHLHPGPAAES